MLRTRFLAVIACSSLTAIVALSVVIIGGSTDQSDHGRSQRIVVVPLRGAPDLPKSVHGQPSVAEAQVEESSVDLSDQALRLMVAELSAHPAVMQWMLTDRLLRRFAEAVEMVAGGMSPSQQLDFLRPEGTFLVQRQHGELVIAPSSFHRYDLAAEAFASLDTEGMVRLLRRFDGAITAAHREVSWYDGDFEDRLVEAMDHLLAVHLPEGPLVVQADVLSYAFAEQDLEQLSDAQRHLLRMGPRNARRVQVKLRQLRAQLRPMPDFEALPVRTAHLEAGAVQEELKTSAANDLWAHAGSSPGDLVIGLAAAP